MSNSAQHPEHQHTTFNEAAMRRGSQLFGQEHCRRVADTMERWDPQFSKLFGDFVYGGLYDRNVLDQKTRELCAVAACVVANALQQLTVHAPAAVRCGATVQEVQEVILQMATYTGMPYMLQAMRHFDTLRENMEQLEQDFKAGKLPPV